MTEAIQRAELEPSFVLHARPFRETSLIVEAFARSRGRIALLARGARRPRSALRAALLAFRPLLLSWTGRGEVRTLVRAEPAAPPFALRGRALICGFYLNELLLKLLAREDPHERLFDAYGEALAALGAGGAQEAVLRRFEIALLRELGYALVLDRDAETGAPIDPEARYVYVPERGPVASASASEGVELSGRTLLDLRAGDFASEETQQQSKALMRALIGRYLGGKTLHTRQLLRELQEL